MNNNNFTVYKQVLLGALLMGSVLILSACGNDETKNEPGQALASVDGEEITIMQLNDELSRAKVQADQIESAKKQLLESIIDRQLMLAEAQRNKLDRAPNVMQAIERAKKQIIAQAYLQNIFSGIDNPSTAEVSEFYQDNPGFFAQHKIYNLTILRFAKKDYSDELKSVIDTTKSPNDVAKWLNEHNISYLLDDITRSTAQMPSEMSATLKEKNKGEKFIVNENEDSLLVSINAIEQRPVTFDEAKARIEMHLLNIKRRETSQAAIARLRASAEIEYLHASEDSVDQATPQPTTQMTNEAVNNPLDDLLHDESIERGISGLK